MKLKFSLKNKEASVDADVEGVVEKVFEHKAKQPPKKTRYQIKQEEKRKNKELEQKHLIQGIIMMGCVLLFILAICFIGSMLGWE